MSRFTRARWALVAMSFAGVMFVGSHAVRTQSGSGSRKPSRSPNIVDTSGSPFASPMGEAETPSSQVDTSSRRLRTTGERATLVADATATNLLAGPGLTISAGAPTTLVLYDSAGPFGWLGEMYGILAVNLASHFGPWTAVPVQSYQAGQLGAFTAVVYVGSTYDEPLPTAFLDDVLTTTKPVIWIRDNIWQLTARWNATHATSFADHFGWDWANFDFGTIDSVLYKEVDLRRYAANPSGVMTYQRADPGVALAFARRPDNTTFPWAVRSRQLTYLGENPFVYVTEGDRALIFEDLLFDALAASTPERHRALVRLEDISPVDDPARLRAIADYLSSLRIPFSFGVSPEYRDPNGVYNGGAPVRVRLQDASARTLVSALRYMQSKGGVMIEHGWTHQYRNITNPYDGVSGSDFEFYRVVEQPDFTLSWVGPVPEEASSAWALGRIENAGRQFRAAGLSTPTIFEFPHYSASVFGYRAAAARFAARYERTLYFRGLLSGGPIDHSRLVGQRFSYVVRDVYGQKVLPENIGNVTLEPFHQFPTRSAAEVVDDARRAKVVRDGFASFYFHPFIDISHLREVVSGILSHGYTFVSPTSL